MYKEVKNWEKMKNNLHFGQGEVKEKVYPHSGYHAAMKKDAIP